MTDGIADNEIISDSDDNYEEKSSATMYEMAVKGSDFRFDYDYDMYGTEVTAVLRPLPDLKFLPIAASLHDHLDMDDEVGDAEAVDEAVDQIEEAKEEAEEGEPIDISKMDKEFVELMQQAAKMALCAEEMEGPDDAEEYIEPLLGGYSVEIGGKALEISGDVRDATKFRGTRGSV